MKQLITIILLLVWQFNALSQYQAPSFTLNKFIQGDSHIYEASESINLKPGFRYVPEGSSDYFVARINQFLLFPPENGVIGGADGNSMVGEFGGSLNINSGAANYTIPLNIPSGVNGMTPSLFLGYNSFSGNGVLGMGWNIGGLSAISRTGSTVYHDEIIRGINLDNLDNLALDGNRLFPTTLGGNEFRTELEGFSKIQIKDSDINIGPIWFEVRTKDGRILQYGGTANARLKPNGKQQNFSWHLNRVEDFQGNYIDYEYQQQNGELLISKVKYGGNHKTGQKHIYEIVFNYSFGRFDRNTIFLAGGSFERNAYLDEIKVNYLQPLTNVISYSFEYDLEGWNLRLKEIRPFTTESQISPLKITWGEDKPDNTLSDTNVWNNSNRSETQTFGDFNGDGKTDIVTAYYIFDQDNEIQHLEWDVRYANSDGTTFTKVVMGELTPENGWKFHSFVAGDFNGDGVTDLFKIRYKKDGTSFTYNTQYHLSNGSNGFISSSQSYPINDFGENFYFLVTDLNGNGVDELLLSKDFNENIRQIVAWELNTIENSFEIVFKNDWFEGYSYSHMTSSSSLFPIQVGDFTGDGKSDLLINTKSGISEIFTLDMNNELSLTPGNPIKWPILVSVSGEMGYPTKWHRVYTGDFNGDGISDILTWNSSAGWEIKYLDGKGGGIAGISPITKNMDPLNSNYVNYLIADYNGDGKSDIIQIYSRFGIVEISVYYSNGLSFSAAEISTHSSTDNIIGGKKWSHVVDFNGDGKADCYLITPIWYANKILFFHKDEKNNLVHSFENSMGVRSSVVYSPLTQGTIYTKRSDAQFPLVDVQIPLNVVISEKHDIGNNHVPTATYRYEGAKIHQRGKGFMGFSTIKITNRLSGIRTDILSDVYLPFYFPYTSKISTFKSTGQQLTETNNQMNHKSFGFSSKVFFPFVQESNSWQKDFNSLTHISTSRENFTYDNYGNLTYQTSLTHSGSLAQGAPASQFDHQINQNTVYYSPNLTTWVIGQPQSTVSQVRYKNNPLITNGKEFKYFISGSLYYPKIQEVLEIPGNNTADPLVTKTEYGYDSYGNVTSTKLTAPNYPGFEERVTTAQFGANYHHRFPTSQTNPAGYTSSMVYDPALGNLLSTKDPNNLETTYNQHPLGISSETIFPDKIKKMNVLRWVSGHTDAPTNAVYYTWRRVSGTPETLTFYNKTGQPLRTVSYVFSGEKLYVDQLYYSSGSSNGRLHKISLPYKSGESAIYTTYAYDPIGRTTSIQYPDGTSSSTQYVGNKIVNTHEGQQSEQTYNAMGWLMESKDNLDKVVKNDYYSDGNLKQAYIDGSLNTAVNLEYNSIGLRTKLNDPNYGVATSLYNPLGQLVSNTSPKNLTSTYQYDILGRMIAETNVEGTISWIYDETNGRKGTLSSVVSPQHSMSYVYDDLLRVTQSTEAINGGAYLTTTSYDAFSRVSTIDYPSGFSTMNIFNEQGNLYKIVNKADNTLLWQTDAVNSIGQITDYRTGNGLITNQTYHSTNNRLLSIHTAVPGQNPLQDLEFQWLNNGNLEHRKKWINRSQNNSLTERFTYDALNRLEEVFLDNIQQGVYHYDEGGLGNLTYKRTDGTEMFSSATYGGSNYGPHALTSISTTDLVIPEVAQNITYSSFEKVTSITQGSKSHSMQYGFHKQRIEQTVTDQSETKQKRWAGACEYITVNGQQTIHTYLSGPMGVYAIHITHPDKSTEINYIHKDHLGSWHTITNESGALLQELSFDAWGQRRNPETWRFFTGTVPPPLFDRGFTGHEHLYAFDLINMNGRVYDPLVSRFLSPDPYIQAPDYSQSFNRYSYVWNNPLKYTDPSGEFLIEAMIIGGFINTSIQLLSGNINSTEDFWMSFGIGVLSGAAGAGAGSYVSSSLGVATTFGSAVTNGAIKGAVGGFSGGFVSGAGNAWMGGANFADGLIAGGKSGISGAFAGAVFGGVSAGYKFNRQLRSLNMRTSGDGVEMTGRRNQRVVFNNDNAKKFQEVYFGEQKGLVGLYADGTFPCIENAEGCAVPVRGTSTTNVYLRESAFRNKLHLFHVMGHEFVHVAQNYAGLVLYTNFAEVGAYSWNEFVSRMTMTEMPIAWKQELSNNWKSVAIDLGKYDYGEMRIDDYFWNNLPTFRFKGIPLW